MSATLISVIIPTFRRPEQALAAARSALAQETALNFEVVLVDNDPEGGALAHLRLLAAASTHPVTLVHEPRAGVANAHNAGLAAAKGELIAFLDDDETASSFWLSELVRVCERFKADVVFGPVRTKLAQRPVQHERFFEAFFARDPGHGEGLIDEFYGCGCSLIRRAALLSPQPFSPARNEIGGEDDLLFQAMHRDGRRFAFA